jgi:hypothetical protein
MAITFVAAGTEQNSTGVNTVEVAAPAGIQDDDLLVLAANQMASGEAISLDEAGWTSVTAQQHASDARLNLHVWIKVASSESGTYTLSVTTNNQWRARMLAYRGVDTTTPQDQTAVDGTETSNSDTHDPAAIVTQTNGAFVLVAVGGKQSGATGVVTQSSGYTVRIDQGAGDGVGWQELLFLEEKEVASAGSETPGQISGLDNSTANDPEAISVTFALRPAATGTTITIPTGPVR